MTCFYIAITTAVLGIIDAVIKICDTLQQKVESKKVRGEKNVKNPILKEFSK